PTAFIASYGSGEPVIGFLAEYDALPGVSQAAVPERQARPDVGAGHGCGHNLYSTASTAAAIAVKQAMEAHGLPGTVRLYGTPAEETLIGKIYMARAGVFEDLDAGFSWHPGDGTGASYDYSKALASAKFRFRGLTAHASTSPHDGRSALDAVEAMNFGVNLMREHVKEDARIHYVITDGGGQPNVVPAFAEVWYYVRANKHLDVEEYFDRVIAVAEGAARMTRTEMEFEVITATHEILPNLTLAKIVDRNLGLIGAPSFTAEEKAFAAKIQEPLGRTFDTQLSEEITPLPTEPGQGNASNDQGDISWFAPIGRMRSACYPVGTPGHSWQIVASGGTTIGQKGMLVAAKT
ncbi:MAG TPA: amidohydrolase, partial [Dehalococcoidia bacterium]|nr:amidohydrolase [Dehalococcoidia bacterium]